LNVGSVAGSPSTPTDGDLWYDSTGNALKARVNGSTVSLGSGTGDVSGPGAATDNAIVRFDGTTGKLVQNSAVTVDDTTGRLTGAIFPNSGLRVQDTDASHTLAITPGSDLTANRTLTVTTGDADRTLVLPLVSALSVVLDGGGAAITTGVKLDIEVPFACTITANRLFADQSGSIVIDIWKDTYANFPPTVADTITASAKPTLSAASKSQDTTLTGWTTAIAAGDVLRFNVDSAATVTRVTLSLTISRT
jgi:hypothetical protein